MRRTARLAKIIKVFHRYRLDTFFADRELPGALKLLVKPARLLPEALLPKIKEPRGARLRMALEELGPVFVKFGQLLSTRPDLVPADMVRELDQLQDNVPPFDAGQFTAIVEAALGDSVDNLFQAFDRQPLASASVAQVHAATLSDGREVVVKAIRPGIERTIEQDIALLETVARLIAKTREGRRLRPVEIVADYRATIFDELNLQREAANASMLRRNFDGSALLYVPEVHWDYSNEKMMVMERIYGTPVTDVDALSQQNTDFKVLAERGVEIFFTQVFEHNFFHADMHPGNIFVDASRPEQPKYLAVDCAIMGTLTDRDQYYLARNLLAVFRRDYRQVAELHVLSGWVPEDTSINEFAGAIRTVCEPIFERPLHEISFGQLLVSLFRTARRFDMQVQPSLVLLQKTLLNIEGLGRQLYPQLDLWATAHPFLERWLKKRVSPSALLDKVKRYGPEWLEQFPHIPQLVYRSLQQIERLEQTIDQRRYRNRRRRRYGRLLPVALIGAGLGLSAPLWSHWLAQAPAIGITLAALGAALLWLRSE